MIMFTSMFTLFNVIVICYCRIQSKSQVKVTTSSTDAKENVTLVTPDADKRRMSARSKKLHDDSMAEASRKAVERSSQAAMEAVRAAEKLLKAKKAEKDAKEKLKENAKKAKDMEAYKRKLENESNKIVAKLKKELEEKGKLVEALELADSQNVSLVILLCSVANSTI